MIQRHLFSGIACPGTGVSRLFVCFYFLSNENDFPRTVFGKLHTAWPL